MKKTSMRSTIAGKRPEVLARFEQCMSALEGGSVRGSQMWRLYTLLRALDALPNDPDAALKHLNDFDRKPSSEDVAGISAKGTQKPSLGNMRVRFNRLKFVV